MDWTQPSLYAAAGAVVFNAAFAHLLARYEQATQTMTRALGSAQDALYVFAGGILLLSLWRDFCFAEAIKHQPKSAMLNNGTVYMTAIVLLVVGCTLLSVALYRLGLRGTFYGDYFKLQLPKRVDGFPFDTLDHPMFVGSTMISLGISLLQSSIAGLVLSGLQWCVYSAIMASESRHTTLVYGPAIPPINVASFRMLAMRAVPAAVRNSILRADRQKRD